MRSLITSLLLVLAVMTVQAQDKTPITLPGKGNINVETLGKRINTKMDISNLNLVELRALRNAFAAKQGYLFMSSDLRMLFNTTSWYDSLAWERELNGEKMGPVKYTKAETKFIDKIKARENELKKLNFTTNTGVVNLDNLINPFQLDVFPSEMKGHLAKYGFGIVEADHEQLFQVYEKNDYTLFPNFVTTDLYLQLFHLYFDTMMRKVEEGKLCGVIADMCLKMHKWMVNRAANDKVSKAAAEWCQAYFAVAYQLIADKKLAVPELYAEMAENEYKKAVDADDGYSVFLGYTDVKFAYGLFRPRGHYTRSELCKRYFRAMMWLQSVPFGTDKDEQLKRAALIAEMLKEDASMRKAYNTVADPITFLMGPPDNVTILQVGDIMTQQGVNAVKLIGGGKPLDTFRKTVEALADKQTRIKPKFENASRVKINFMPQRYQPDGEVLQEMCDYDNIKTKRDVPMGLDVMAAMGSTAAERILIDELKQDQQWEGFKPHLADMKKMMSGVDWKACVSNRWLDALNAVNTDNDARLPYFMKTPQWDKKDLNATLASWAELKHDAILYAKQPFAAECGDGSLPQPTVVAFVEPHVAFWKKAIALLDGTRDVLTKYQLLTPNIEEITNEVREEAEFLLKISEKELAGKTLTDEEYNSLRYIGATFEHLSLEMLKEPDQVLQGWSDVQGTDKSVAIVADVYTANGNNNPDKSILFEAVGPANEIYVVVEINGLLYLTRGAVLSYREFKRPLNLPRMNDEEWQEHLKTSPDTGKPSWLKEIIIPLKTKPVDNEAVYYGSGC